MKSTRTEQMVEKYYQQFKKIRRNTKHSPQAPEQLSQCIQNSNMVFLSHYQSQKNELPALDIMPSKQSKYNLRIPFHPEQQMTGQEKYQKLMQLLKCQNFREAETKIMKTNENEKFIKRLKEMINLCQKDQRDEQKQISLGKCWKFIKSVVQEAYRQKKTNKENVLGC